MRQPHRPEEIGTNAPPPVMYIPQSKLLSPQTLSVCLGASLAVALLAAGPARAEVVINEIFYHPASEDIREEYVELLNTGPESAHLGGWSFSDGIDFLFPDVTLPPGGMLVVAADVGVFHSIHPGVTNVVGDWTGQLSNSDEDLDLDDTSGSRVDSVHYADQGDWAIRQEGLPDRGHRGWDWAAAPDGGGRSLELVNPSLSNNHGQNWQAGLVTNGTPGAANSVFQSNVAPLILEVQHLPPVPRSVDDVLVTARLLDEQNTGLSASVHWRVDGTPAFTTTIMFDDGLHDDGSAGDGVFAALLPAQPADSVVEFYIEATDDTLLTRTWPAPALDENGVTGLGQVVNALYQVDDSTYEGAQPLYKIIMLEAERAELEDIGDDSSSESRSKAQMNATFISINGSDTDVRYTIGARNRGESSRHKQPNSYRINFTSDRRWKGITALNINGQYTHVQILGSVLMLKSGAVCGASRPAQVRVNNANLGNNGPQTYGSVYAANEVVGSDWAEHWLPDDSSGNAYRVIRYDLPDEFQYRGDDPSAYTNTYFKTTNESEDDWTDLIGMLSIIGTNDPFAVEAIRGVADLEEWMIYLAANALFNNRETSPNTGHNDDYLLYAGLDDPRFLLVAHDLDTLLGQGDTYGSRSGTIFGAFGQGNDGAFDLSSLFAYPEFEALYYRTVQHLLDTTFSKSQFDATTDQTLGAFVPAATLDDIKSWMDVRRDYVLGVVAPYLATLTNAPVATVSGEPRSPTPRTDATLSVGGQGVTHYRYALNGGAFGASTTVAGPIVLSGLPDGSTNSVRVIGGDSNGVWQAETDAAVSATWVVDTGMPFVRINEVLAANATAFDHHGTFPDAIELYNQGTAAVDLSGMRLSDRITSPDKFVFPNGTTLAAGAYLVVSANDPDGTPGMHTGFSLKRDGEGVFLFDAASAGGALLDAVSFGLQLADLSIGRLGGGAFTLTQPTFGGGNLAQPLADPGRLLLNEWFTDGFALIPEDFIEIHNPSSLPAALGGLYLTDNPIGEKTRHRIEPLSFIQAVGHQAFTADGKPGKGADHVDFKLAREQGLIALLAGNQEVIDCVSYGPQSTDVSQGRTPDGGGVYAFFSLPSPGAPNPNLVVAEPVETLVSMTNAWRYYQDGSLDGVDWTDAGYDDSAWPEGPALLYNEDGALPAPKNTELSLTHGADETTVTYYFRTRFTFTNDPAASVVRLTTIVDDGCVVYLNGTPVHWLRLAENSSPVFSTLAEDFVNNAAVEGPSLVPGAALAPGENVLAVEVHQSSLTSSDVAFGLQLDVVTPPAVGGEAVLNEVLANNRSFTNQAGRTPDWIELMNTSTSAVNLAGLSLSDNPANPRKWVFPSGSMLAGGERLVVACDDSLPASVTNTGFALASEGESVHLYRRLEDGGGELDSIPFGLQVPDFSLGRVPDGSGAWSLALPTRGRANVAAALGNASELRINEWMAEPATGDDWFELYNPNPQPVAVGGLALTDDANERDKSPFPPASFVAAAGFARLAADDNTPAGADHVGFRLNSAGDFLGLYRPTGTQIDGLSFGAQDAGVSEGRFRDGTGGILRFPGSASPGGPNYLQMTNLVVNELLSHSDVPLEDAVEIYNPGSDPVDIGGWFLSDAAEEPRKFLVPPGTVVGAGGFAVLYESQFGMNAAPAVIQPFAFDSAHGGEVHLSQTDASTNLTGHRVTARFGASANGVSFGRFRTTIGEEFTAMRARSFGVDAPVSLPDFRSGTGASNTYPLVGPVILGELHFDPATNYAGDAGAAEFIELRNITTGPVPLYDPAAATNTWRLGGGVSYVFPTNVTLAAGESLVVVGFSPRADAARSDWFRNVYSIPAGIPLYGPWSGSLDRDGEAVELYRPDPPQPGPGPDTGYVPQVLVERVVYGPTAPWPTHATAGASLQRRVAEGFGNEPVNWFAALPSAGRDNLADTDGDGLPDYWERENGLDPDSPDGDHGADGNPDGDAFTNREEWETGTRADDPLDFLQILSLTASPEGMILRFRAAGGRRHHLVASDQLPPGPWRTVADVPLSAHAVTWDIADPSPGNATNRFYGITATSETLP